ncbi:MAG: superoxide dismutase [Chthonomonadaceae bacterium]|nr:superoxide dismutase [Chthonomonadaceae bacterium]
MPEFTLPALPYDVAALEPHIDAQTMTIHHDKHHQTYVNNLNAALKDQTAFDGKTVEEIVSNLDSVPEAARTAVRNNGGGHVNHTLFWDILTPGGSNTPTGELAEKINSTFGSYDELKKAMNDAGTKRFGSGWAWLVADASGTLSVMSLPNQDSPLSEGKTPLLGIDVWEHAYYLKYQNKRPDYLAAIWNVINWDKVAARYSAK